MKKNINVCIIGGGNISNTRHIPALKKLSNVNIIGVMSNSQKAIDRTIKKYGIKNSALINNPKNDIKTLEKTGWFKKVDAVVIGVPPKQHYPLVKMALMLHKHVLVEKPMMMNKEECEELIELSKKENRQFCVMHNFQYANGMLKLNKIIDSKIYGDISAITEIQFTNRNRRLPEWYNELPLGLFYDEAAHFIYLAQNHGGKLKVENAYAIFNNKKDATPKSLNVDVLAGKIPVHMMLNFNSPICEWYYIVNFEEKIYIYDIFKDVLIGIKTDGEHKGKQILKNSFSFFFQYWKGFIINGFKMISGNLLYGHDIVMKNYINGIVTKKYDSNIQCEKGMETVISMNEIAGAVKHD